jgi:hypothetical protein
MDFELTPAMVVWHDAHVGTDGWEDYVNLEDDGPCVVNSCGFLLPTDKGGKENHISMVATFSSDGMVHSVFHIPVQMVQRVEVLVRSHELGNAPLFSPQGSAIRGT